MRNVVMSLFVVALVAAVPATAGAQDSGGQAPPGEQPPTEQPQEQKQLSKARTTTHVLRGRTARVRGSVVRGAVARKFKLQARIGGKWTRVTGGSIGDDRIIQGSWTTRTLGFQKLRLLLYDGDGKYLEKNHLPPGLTVYREALASWYGPGFYGRRTACGQTYTRTILGVAHKTLKCGTKVTLRYRGRSITVPVIDRGPYHGSREIDLSNATREALDFEGVHILWSTR